MSASPAISACVWSECHPHMVRDVILPALQRCPLVNEVIIFHAHRGATFDYPVADKFRTDIVHRYPSEDGTIIYAPWLAWQHAKNDIVLSLDDDALCWNTSIAELYGAYSRAPDVIHSSAGNVVSAGHRIEPGHVYGRVAIAHTHTMMFHKRLADRCLANVSKVFSFGDDDEDNRLGGHVQKTLRSCGWLVPHNAAILASLVAFKHSGHLNNVAKVAVLPLHNMTGELITSLDKRTWRAEMEKRTAFLQNTMQCLGLDNISVPRKTSAMKQAIKQWQSAVKRRGEFIARAAINTMHTCRASYYKNPNFFILGPERGGTTSLLHYLSQHSHVVPCRVKEPMYYAFSFPVGEPLYPFPQTHNREVRFRRYKSNFPPKWKSQRGTLTGEASPQYFYAPEAPARIRKDFPDMRFIVSLRDPRRRAWSLYHLYAQERDKRDYARDREESGSFIEALEKEKRHEDAGLPMLLSGLRPTQLYQCLNVDGKTGKTGNTDNKFPYDGHYGYLSTCYYAYWLKHWFKFFDRSRFLIIQAETLFADPDEVIQRVHKFLGLDVEPLNSTGKRDTTPVSYSPPPPDVEQLLTDYFKEPNRELFELLGEEFNWA